MPTRRRYLAALSATALAGCSQARNALPGNSQGVGDTYEHKELEITPTDVQTVDQLTIVLEGNPSRTVDRRKQITASENGDLVAVELSIKNNGIESKKVPAWNVKSYKKMRKDENDIAVTGLNDIRLFADDKGGALPASRRLQFPVDHIDVDGEELPLYPTIATGTSGPSVSADEKLTGWIYGEVLADGTPRLKMTLGSDDVWWDLE